MGYNPHRTKAQTMNAIRAYWQHYGYSPTYQELADLLGVKRTAAHNRVRNLRADGSVIILDRAWRNIVLPTPENRTHNNTTH